MGLGGLGADAEINQHDKSINNKNILTFAQSLSNRGLLLRHAVDGPAAVN